MSNKNTKPAGNRFSTQRSKARHKGKRQRPFPHEHNSMAQRTSQRNTPNDTSEALATWQTAQQGPAAPGMGPY